MISISRRCICLAGLAPWIATAKSPVPGVSDTRIMLGQTIGYDSVWGSLYKNYSDGLLAFFARTNAEGGVYGRRIELVRKEDNYATDKALENIRQFGQGEEVFGLACIAGTGITLAAMPLLEQYKLPTVGTLTGADGVREYNRYLFHTRTSYSSEVDKMVEHLATVGIRNISVVHQDNAFGKSCLNAAERAAVKHKAKLVAKLAHPTDKWDTAAMVGVLEKARPQAVLLFTSPGTVADLIKGFKTATGSSLPSPWVLSVTSIPKLRELLGPDVRGIAMTQVMPHPQSGSSHAAREFRISSEKHGNRANVTYEAMEGYMTGRVIVAALRRTGRDLTREGYVKALESFADLKLDEIQYRYSPTAHLGPSFVEVTFIGSDGSIVR
jgi:branched-chain amino acid transport system substrate-binding protein